MPADSWGRHLVAACVLYRDIRDWELVNFMSNVLQMHEEHGFREGRRLSLPWEGPWHCTQQLKDPPTNHPCCSAGLNLYPEQCLLGKLYKKTRILFSLWNIYLSWILSCCLWRWLRHVAILRSQVYICCKKIFAVFKTCVLSLQSFFVLKRMLLSWDFNWNGLLPFQKALRGSISPPISFWQKWEQSCNRAFHILKFFYLMDLYVHYRCWKDLVVLSWTKCNKFFSTHSTVEKTWHEAGACCFHKNKWFIWCKGILWGVRFTITLIQ